MQQVFFSTLNIARTIYICQFRIIIFRQASEIYHVRSDVLEGEATGRENRGRLIIATRFSISDRANSNAAVEYPLLVVSRSVSRRVNMLPVRGLTDAISRVFYERPRYYRILSALIAWARANQIDLQGSVEIIPCVPFICVITLTKASLMWIRELLRAWLIKSRNRDKETS